MKIHRLLYILIFFSSTPLFSQIKIGINAGVTLPFTTVNDLIDIRYNQPDSLISFESVGIYNDIVLTKETQYTYNLNLLIPFTTDSSVSFFTMFRIGSEKYSWMKKGTLISDGTRRINNSGQSNSFNKNSGNILSDTIPVIVSESKNTVQSIAFDVISYTTLNDIGISFLLGLGTNIITGNNTSLSSHETYKNETIYYELYSGESGVINKVLFSGVVGLEKEIPLLGVYLTPAIIYRRSLTDVSTYSTVKLDNLSFTLGVRYSF